MSSNIKNHKYDSKTETLTITFIGGVTYTYSGVKPDDYIAFENAESKGKHFHTNIKNNFKWRKHK